jgi:signal transduction histidine kinase/ligand-binding sensor domain-containing protein
MYKQTIFLILLTLFLLAADTRGAEVIYNRSEQIKLTHLYVSDIVKDKAGYMWLGTSRGLNRWDGYNYKYFLSDKNDSSSISNNQIVCLFTDNEGMIWVGTANGLNLLDPVSEKFTHYLHAPNDSNSISSNSIRSITEDKNGNLWVGTKNGLSFFDKEEQKFHQVKFPAPIANDENYNEIRSLFCDSNGILWVGFNYSGILAINSNSNEMHFKMTWDAENPENSFIPSINDFHETQNGSVLIATWGIKVLEANIGRNGIIMKSWAGNKAIDSDIVMFVKEDDNNNIWISDFYNHISCIDKNFNIISQLETNDTKTAVPSTHISCMKNINNRLWIGTYNHGFYQINYKQKPVSSLPFSDTPNQKESFQVMNLTHIPPNKIAVATTNETLLIYDEDKQVLEKIPHPYPSTQSVHFDSTSEVLWIGSYSNSIMKYNLEKEELTNYELFPSDFTQFSINSNDSLVFISLWANGVRIFNKNTQQVFYPGKNSDERFFSSLDFFLDDDVLWIATNENGIMRYNIKQKDFKTFPVPSTTQSILPSNQFNLIKRLNNGKLIVNSIELGLCYFDPQNKIFTPVGDSIGVNALHFKAIIEDNNDNLWLISERSAIKTDYEFKTYFAYTVNDGLKYGIEHNGATYSPHSNYIYLGGQRGLQRFSITETLQTSSFPDIVITGFSIFDEDLKPASKQLNGKGISYTDTLKLNYNQNFITLSYSSMLYDAQSNNEYRYRMEGVNNDWHVVPYSQNSITYSNLSPGSYNFYIEASNEHGVWPDKYTQLTIIITPPFWQTLWFKILFILTIIIAGGLYIQHRLQRITIEKRKLEKLVSQRSGELILERNKVMNQNRELEKANQLKNKFFNIIAHDLRSPMSSIVQLSELLRDTRSMSVHDKQEIKNNIAHSANSTMELLDDLLVWAKSQNSNIEYNIVRSDIYPVIEQERKNLNYQADNKGVIIENNAAKNIYAYFDISSIRTILRNLISNAIKFSHPGKKIIIGNEIKNNDVIVSVKDEGTGIAKDKAEKLFKQQNIESTSGTNGETGTGLGLKLCHEFISKNNGEIWVESEPGKGSTFYFSLPLASSPA